MCFLSACTWTPHEIQINPQTNVAESNIGQGKAVYFRFLDERDDTTVGHRGVATVGAKVTSANLAQTVENALREGLRKKQFQFTSAESDADAALTYRLRSFKFDIEAGFFTAGRNAAAALAVDARRRDRSYNNVYRYNSETRIMFAPGGGEIDQQMNEALTQILTKALNDPDLDRFLTER